MTDHIEAPETVAAAPEEHEEHHAGTWAILGIYLVAIIVMWVWVYVLLIARG